MSRILLEAKDLLHMSDAELSLRFSGNNRVNVSFDGTDSGALPFENPVTAKDRSDIRWYIETYGVVSLDAPDDKEAKRIEARLAEIGKALFKCVFLLGSRTAFLGFS